MRLEITYPDGEPEVVAVTPGDRVRFENHFDRPWTVLLDPAESREEHWIWLAWRAKHRGVEFDQDSFMAWADEIEGVGFVAASDDPPTKRTPKTGVRGK